jgi:DNA-binding response OmpR family regulator
MMTAAAAHRVLLVEDNEAVGRQVVATLGGAGYEVDWIRRGDEAIAAVSDEHDLVILDLMLPGASGFEVLAQLRRQGVRTPVLIASACTDSRDKLRAQDLGARDYLTKPFWPQELLGRVAACLGRTAAPVHLGAISMGEVTIDVAARRVVVAGSPVPLARDEFDLLMALAQRRGAAVSRAGLLERMSPEDRGADPADIDALVSRVREKLGGAGTRIRAVWGVGYCWDA